MSDITNVSPQGYDITGTTHPFWEKENGGTGGGIQSVNCTETIGTDYKIYEWSYIDSLNIPHPIVVQKIPNKNGVTFTPYVSPEGVISWTNDGGLDNPAPVNIKGDTGPAGPEGPKGQRGEKGNPGNDGADGVSPTFVFVPTSDGYSMTVIAADGTQTISIANGKDGEKGDQGEKGDSGEPGFSPVISIEDITGGHKVTITTETGTIDFDVMDGAQGEPGKGLVISGTVATYTDLPSDLTEEDAGNAYLVESDGKLYVWSGTSFPAEGNGSEFTGPQGEPGTPGYSPVISVSDIEGGHRVTITNENGDQNFDVMDGQAGIQGPAGQSITMETSPYYDSGEIIGTTVTFYGSQGSETINVLNGSQGMQGPAGEKGENGNAATISPGTVTMLSAGSAPYVNNSGTAQEAVFNFGIPYPAVSGGGGGYDVLVLNMDPVTTLYNLLFGGRGAQFKFINGYLKTGDIFFVTLPFAHSNGSGNEVIKPFSLIPKFTGLSVESEYEQYKPYYGVAGFGGISDTSAGITFSFWGYVTYANPATQASQAITIEGSYDSSGSSDGFYNNAIGGRILILRPKTS